MDSEPSFQSDISLQHSDEVEEEYDFGLGLQSQLRLSALCLSASASSSSDGDNFSDDWADDSGQIDFSEVSPRDIMLPSDFISFQTHKKVAGLNINEVSVFNNVDVEDIRSRDLDSLLSSSSDSNLKPTSLSLSSASKPHQKSSSLGKILVHPWSKSYLYPLSRSHFRRSELSSEAAEKHLVSFLDSYDKGLSHQYVTNGGYWSVNTMCKEAFQAATFHVRLFRDVDCGDIIFEFQRRTGSPQLFTMYFKALKSLITGEVDSTTISRTLSLDRLAIPNLRSDSDSLSALANIIDEEPCGVFEFIGGIIRQRSVSAPPMMSSRSSNERWQGQLAGMVCSKISELSQTEVDDLPRPAESEPSSMENAEGPDPLAEITSALEEEKHLSKVGLAALAMTCLATILATSGSQHIIQCKQASLNSNNVYNATNRFEGNVNVVPFRLNEEEQEDQRIPFDTILPAVRQAFKFPSPHGSLYRQSASNLVEQLMASENMSTGQRIEFIASLV